MPAVARLRGLTTAVPSHALPQEDVMAAAGHLFDRPPAELDRLMPAYVNAGIAQRHSCVPLDWYFARHGWHERTALFVEHAPALLADAAERCLASAGMAWEQVDAIVTVSSTGIATPSLDALLMERLPFRRDVMRLPVFGLGCAGGVLGFSRAAELARAAPGRNVLLLVVELCALTFRRGDNSKSNVIATALFGDGAAAALISCDGDGPALGPAGEYTWPGTLDVMGWHVEEDGLGVLFSRDIPTLVRTQFRPAMLKFLARHGIAVSEIERYVCHPGGAKVIEALEDALAMEPGSMTEARDILRRYGNMSAPTALFVLERMLATRAEGPWLMTALGPGFTAAFQILGPR
ncbi:type III polyketide synthase [Hypericibacter sp.]|uniref:type III polyketide synthase n=1 Tax=Hypericibacter sp. TaxID=2705401 RepID=UPI003D6D612C